MKNPKYIFVVGGVMSGVGKGIATSSIATILQARGYKVTAAKIDPYVNVDAGTMNPTEHGEVFVLDDGLECDQDMGNYERFLNTTLSRANYMTTGSVYQTVIQKERAMEYGGKCVEVVPHIPLEVIARLRKALTVNKAEIIITEIGGTIGEYQNILFLEAVRMLKIKQPNDVALVLVSYMPQMNENSELKSKPTQYAVRSLNAAGLQPDFVIARALVSLDDKRKEKIAFNCGLPQKHITSAPDVRNIYEVPLNFEKDHLSENLLNVLGLPKKASRLSVWNKFVENSSTQLKPIRVGIIGKYFDTGSFVLSDSYISVIEAVKHAAAYLKRKPIIEWLNAESYDAIKNINTSKALAALKNYDGIIVPGGFGSRGVEGKINAIQHLRENKIPFLGLCYGMQLAVVEYARNKAKLAKAHTIEVDPKTEHPVIDIMPEQEGYMLANHYGGTMRLGAYDAILEPNTVVANAYKAKKVSERHRHRYEVNPFYVETLEKVGLVFSGKSPSRMLMEYMELPERVHPFFVGTQAHPEFKSRPQDPHPLFVAFLEATNKI